jgi:hypothetical protein
LTNLHDPLSTHPEDRRTDVPPTGTSESRQRRTRSRVDCCGYKICKYASKFRRGQPGSEVLDGSRKPMICWVRKSAYEARSERWSHLVYRNPVKECFIVFYGTDVEGRARAAASEEEGPQSGRSLQLAMNGGYL